MLAKHYSSIKEFLLRKDFDGFKAKDLFIIWSIKKAWGQDIAALSNMAEALVSLQETEVVSAAEVRILIDNAVTRALHKKVSPYRKDPREVKNLGRHGYYLAHLNIILGCYQRVSDEKYLSLNQSITQHLLKSSLEENNLHAPLLPNVKMRWSADQAAIIYSIWLFDKNNNTSLSAELIEGWLAYMENSMRDKETGLFCTEVMRTQQYSRQPRGCALAYLIYYTSYFALDVAGEQWGRFKQYMMFNRIGMAASREYLPRYKGGWTPDSGPIIGGVGVAASGLSLKAAAALSDHETYSALRRSVGSTMALLRAVAVFPKFNRVTRIGTDLLATSIALNAETQFQRNLD